MSYSLENRTIDQLKEDLVYYAKVKNRISQDHFRLKMVLTAQIGRSHPKSDLKMILEQFYAVLDENSQSMQQRIGTMENKVHQQIAKLFEDGQATTTTGNP